MPSHRNFSYSISQTNLRQSRRIASWSANLSRRSKNLAAKQLLCLLLWLSASPAFGQTIVPGTGIPPFSTFSEGNFDRLNLQNLNVFFQIPLVSSPGRGISVNEAFVYNSLIWTQIPDPSHNGKRDWIPVASLYRQTWGWTADNFSTDILYTHQKVTCSVNPTQTAMHYSNYFSVGPNGTAHGFPIDFYDTATDCRFNTGPTSGIAGDESGYFMQANPQTSPVLYSPAGLQTNLGGGLYQDSNGNQINSSGVFGQTIKDSLNRTALKISETPTQWTYQIYDSNGNLQSVLLNFQSFNIQTNFGCSNIVEYSLSSEPLPVSLVLPNGQTYTFQYETTPGFPGSTTGRLFQVTLPTGGSIQYQYSGGVDCGTGSPVNLTRIVTNGSSSYTWQYSRSAPTSSNITTTITAPQLPYDSISNQRVFNYVTGQTCSYNVNPNACTIQTDKLYQGSASSGTLLETITTTLVAPTPYPNYIGVSFLKAKVVTLPTNQQSQVVTTYDAYGNVLGVKEYDWGNSAPGALLRSFTNTYLSSSTYTNIGISNRLTSTVIADGSGNTVAQTQYEYDNYTQNISPSGAVQHNSSYGTAYTTRGNVTAIQQWRNTDGGWLTTRLQYDDAGNILSASDLAGHANAATFSYSDVWANTTCAPAGGNAAAYITGFTNALLQPITVKYNSCTGSLASTTEANNQTKTQTYDILGRITQENFPDGGKTTITYNDSSYNPSTPSPSVTTTSAMTSSLNVTALAARDSLGQTVRSGLTSDPDCSTGDRTDTTYDALGRVYTVSNPYCSTSDPTYGLTTYAYDGLGRTIKVTFPDNSVNTTSYSGNTTTVTDQAGKSRQFVTDGLGRLTQVFEDPGSSPHLNYETDYFYDALNNINMIQQKGGSTNIANWRTRTFVYNSLSQLTSSINPESNTIPSTGATLSTTYDYDANGNLTSKTSLAPNQTGSATVTVSYCYDVLNRMTAKAYTFSPNSPPTCSGNPPTFPSPAATFTYDVSSLDGDSAFTNTVGRLVRATTTGTSPTKTYYSYDSMGRVLYLAQCANINCGNWGSSPNWWVIANTFDLMGNLTSYTDGQTNTFTQKFDAAGRPWQLTSSWVDSNHPQNLYTVGASAQPNYNPVGGINSAQLGNAGSGLTAAYAYNNRLQPCRVDWNTSALSLANCTTATPSTSILDFTYGFNSGSNNGNIASWKATGQQTFTRSLGYDNLNRLATMQETGGNLETCKPASSPTNPYTISWTIDSWGNRTAQSPSQGSCSFNQPVNAQNRFSAAPFAYDSAGNMTNDGSHSYTYDAENRLLSVDGGATATYLYNAAGQRVAKGTSSSWLNYYLYGINGQVVSDTLANGTSWNQTYIRFGGQLVAQYRGTATGFILQDHLGSTRLDTAYPWVNTSQSIYDNMDYLPFGEEVAGGTATTHKFTGDERDTETNLDHAEFRQYSSNTGRWMTPDPAGLAAVNPSNPQSLNRYTYVLNNPLNFTDPSGLVCVWADGSYDAADDPVTGTQQGCEDAGGAWIDDTKGGSWSDQADEHRAEIYQEIMAQMDGESDPTATIQVYAWDTTSSGNNSSSGWWGTAWLETKVFFQGMNKPLSTDPGSCLAVAVDAVVEPLEAVHEAVHPVEENLAPLIAMTTSGAPFTTTSLSTQLWDMANPIRAKQISPEFVSFVRNSSLVISGAGTALANAVQPVVAAVEEYLPEATLATVDIVGARAVVKEGIAAAKGQCHP